MMIYWKVRNKKGYDYSLFITVSSLGLNWFIAFHYLHSKRTPDSIIQQALSSFSDKQTYCSPEKTVQLQLYLKLSLGEQKVSKVGLSPSQTIQPGPCKTNLPILPICQCWTVYIFKPRFLLTLDWKWFVS